MTGSELWLERIFFGVCAALALAGGVGTIAFKNPIRGALSLLFCIVAIAGMYLQLPAPFLAAVQLIVYAGAVVVLFLFVIMLIGPDAVPPKDARGIVARIIGGIAVSLIAVQVLRTIASKWQFQSSASRAWQAAHPGLPVPGDLFMAPVQPGFGSVESFGALLFSDWLVPFEVGSVLLLVAIVGALAVGRGKQPDPQLETAKAGAAGKTEDKEDA